MTASLSKTSLVHRDRRIHTGKYAAGMYFFNARPRIPEQSVTLFVMAHFPVARCATLHGLRP
jgi:hypothetical protein